MLSCHSILLGLQYLKQLSDQSGPQGRPLFLHQRSRTQVDLADTLDFHKKLESHRDFEVHGN